MSHAHAHNIDSSGASGATMRSAGAASYRRASVSGSAHRTSCPTHDPARLVSAETNRSGSWHRCLIIALALLSCFSLPAHADDMNVRFEVSPRETAIGVPVTLSIIFDNAKSFDNPTIPSIDGAAVQPVPGSNRSSMMQIVNGQMKQRDTVTLTYRVVPARAGSITIPPITVKADGQSFTSDAIEISVTKSETSDLLFVDVQTDKTSIYVGQALPVTLRVWVRPYQDRRMDLRLNADQMFSLICFKSSDWGDFSDDLSKLRDNFGQLRVQWSEELRADAQGEKHTYFVYKVPSTIWPQQPGRLTLNSPSIVVKYPVRLKRDDSFLGMGELSLAESRTLRVTADLPDFTVKAPPTEGQPATFSGAVGQFDFAARAKPAEVSVGDPITLTMTVTDRTPGSGARIDLLPPPALDRVSELTENFKMPSDPLAGTVNGRTKTFTQTLRARSDQVNRVPPIPFTYFDPNTEKYVTRLTEAVPIKVSPVSQLAMNAVVGTTAPAAGNQNANFSGTQGADLTEMAGGILANVDDVDAMLTQQGFRPNWLALAGLLVPPVLLTTMSLRRWRAGNRMSNATALRRRGARRKAITRVNAVASGELRSQAQGINAAIGEYVADRFNLPPGALATGDVLATLQRHDAPWDLVQHARTLLDECDQMVYAGGLTADNGSLAARGRDLINRLERSNLK